MNYDTLLDELPSSLRSQLATMIYRGNQLHDIKFFNNLHPNIINAILPLLKRLIIKKDEVIYQDGDITEESIFNTYYIYIYIFIYYIYIYIYYIVYFIQEGKIRFASSDNFVFRLMYRGETFGVTEIINKEVLSI